MHLLLFFFFFSLFNVRAYFMSFVLSNLRVNNISNDIVFTIKQLVDVDDVLLSFITLNTKTWAYELNSNLENKSEWTLCYLLIQIWTNRLRFQNSKFQGQQNHITHKPVPIIRIYLNEKLNFHHHILVRNAQMYIRLEDLIN